MPFTLGFPLENRGCSTLSTVPVVAGGGKIMEHTHQIPPLTGTSPTRVDTQVSILIIARNRERTNRYLLSYCASLLFHFRSIAILPEIKVHFLSSREF